MSYQIRCAYFVVDPANKAAGCRVVNMLGGASSELRSQLKMKRCLSGQFINCPLYRLVQKWLEESHAQLRDSEPVLVEDRPAA